MKNTRTLLFAALLFIVLLVAIYFSITLPKRVSVANLDFMIQEENGNLLYETNEPLLFILNDSSSYKKRNITWQFGNGYTVSNENKIEYSYSKPNRYKITLKIDNKFFIDKIIDVVEPIGVNVLDSLPQIMIPNTVYVDEEFVATSLSKGATAWTWEFGETLTVDAYDEQVTYSYKKPGTYRIKFQANNAKYPIQKKITVLPLFSIIETEAPKDSIGMACFDIKEKLQNIAEASYSDTRTYKKNLNYIINTYTCDKGKSVVVKVNNSKYNDLYSYCQGIHYLEGKGASGIKIDSVMIDTMHCMTKLNVLQSEKSN